MKGYSEILETLFQPSKTWLITGVAGFIGSNLAEALLANGQKVVGLDNLSTGKQENIVGFEDKAGFTFVEGDIRNFETCREACEGVDYVLHHAALASVPMSIEDPELTDAVNNGGFVNVMRAARHKGVKRVVYASSSAVYGEEGAENARRESDELSPLSPYAETKCANETYAAEHEVEAIGLRYFNIYGERQDPDGAYAAVIPKWINTMLAGEDVVIFGDGSTVRDFCSIEDVVQVNVLAALSEVDCTKYPVFNVAAGGVTTLNELFEYLKEATEYEGEAVYKDFREADIKVSMADINKARDVLGFEPSIPVKEGLVHTVQWYKDN